MSTAINSIAQAHAEVLSVAKKIDRVLAGYEGFPVTLSYREIAEQIGVDLLALQGTRSWLLYMSADAALERRGWSAVSEPGVPKRFAPKLIMRHFVKPSESPVARSRRKASAARS